MTLKSIYQNPRNSEGEIVLRSMSDRVDVLSRIREGTFSSVLVQDNGYRKSVIFELALQNIPFRSVSYGAGVYRLFKEERME